jgi:hypothetical protein
MDIDWGENCNRAKAVAQIFITSTSSQFELAECSASWLENVVTDAFEGLFGRVSGEKLHKHLANLLMDVVPKLNSYMDLVRLDTNKSMPPILWMRLVKEASVTLPPKTQNSLDKWFEAQRRQDKLPLYLYNADGVNKGPKRNHEDFGDVLGYSIEGLLTETKDKPRYWPYCREWHLVLREKPNNEARELVGSSDKGLVGNAPIKSVKPSQSVLRSRLTKKRHKRSRADIERICGAGVVAALESCLDLDSGLKVSVVELHGRNHRQYASNLSLNELVEILKEKYSSSLPYKDSTIKSALPLFVSCPRGRPTRLTDQITTISALKKRR